MQSENRETDAVFDEYKEVYLFHTAFRSSSNRLGRAFSRVQLSLVGSSYNSTYLQVETNKIR